MCFNLIYRRFWVLMAGWTGGIWRNTLRLGYITRMPDSTPSFRVKVETIFRELAGDRAVTLDAQRLPARARVMRPAAGADGEGEMMFVLIALDGPSASAARRLRQR